MTAAYHRRQQTDGRGKELGPPGLPSIADRHPRHPRLCIEIYLRTETLAAHVLVLSTRQPTCPTAMKSAAATNRCSPFRVSRHQRGRQIIHHRIQPTRKVSAGSHYSTPPAEL